MQSKLNGSALTVQPEPDAKIMFLWDMLNPTVDANNKEIFIIIHIFCTKP
jgi:hypothetical protein